MGRPPPTAEGSQRVRPSARLKRRTSGNDHLTWSPQSHSTISTKGAFANRSPKQFVLDPSTKRDARLLDRLSLPRELKVFATKSLTSKSTTSKTTISKSRSQSPGSRPRIVPEADGSGPAFSSSNQDSVEAISTLKSKLHSSEVKGELLLSEIDERRSLEHELREDIALAKEEVDELLKRTQVTMQLVAKAEESQSKTDLESPSSIKESKAERTSFKLERKKRIELEEEFEQFKKDTQGDVEKLVNLHKAEQEKLVSCIKDIDSARLLEIENHRNTEELLAEMRKHVDELAKRLEENEEEKAVAAEYIAALKEDNDAQRNQISKLEEQMQRFGIAPRKKELSDLEVMPDNSILESAPPFSTTRQLFFDEKSPEPTRGDAVSSYLDRLVKNITSPLTPTREERGGPNSPISPDKEHYSESREDNIRQRREDLKNRFKRSEPDYVEKKPATLMRRKKNLSSYGGTARSDSLLRLAEQHKDIPNSTQTQGFQKNLQLGADGLPWCL